MAKLTLNDITGGYQTADAYNVNNALIEAAFENTLSRDGTTPNQMSADIDMNSNSLGNVVDIDMTGTLTNTGTTNLSALILDGTVVTVIEDAATVAAAPDATQVSYTPSGGSLTTLQDALDDDYYRNDVAFEVTAVGAPQIKALYDATNGLQIEAVSNGDVELSNVKAGNTEIRILDATTLRIQDSSVGLVMDKDINLVFGNELTSENCRVKYSDANDYVSFNMGTGLIGGIEFQSGGFTRMKITPAGNLDFDGGTVSTDTRELDDYDERTAYDVGLESGTGSITMNGSFDKLNITRVGQLVTVQGILLVASVSTPGGALSMTLPWATNATFGGVRAAVHAEGVSTIADGFNILATMANNSSTVIFYKEDASTNIGSLMQASATIGINFSYVTDDAAA